MTSGVKGRGSRIGHESPDTTSRYLGLVKEDPKREYDRAIEVILSM